MINSIMAFKYTFTVFTPTYNRAHTLQRVYESLLSQTFRDFEWLVVDDYSTDTTSDLIEKWKKENIFPINFIQNPLKGKHFAFNLAVNEAQGLLFLPLDSDDECVPKALERLKIAWDSIPTNKISQFSGVSCLVKDQNNRISGTYYPEEKIDLNYQELIYRYKLKGEKWGFHKTNVLRQFPFPEIHDIRYVPESIVWSAIGRKYKTRCINEALRIYWITNSSDQLSSTLKNKEKTGPYLLLHKNILNNDIRWFFYSPQAFVFSGINYSRFSFHCKKNIAKQCTELHNNYARILLCVCLIAGIFMYNLDVVRGDYVTSTS